MNRKMSKRQRDMKTKLMAAICMLLVSSIMMVSTTYAWFTLSTAPEVKGISTAVGANGNLEIALLPKDGQTASISTAVGDSIKAVKEKNITWGNLVDLSDGSIYGLDGITLYPAALNGSFNAEKKLQSVVAESLLMTPNYGGDGRVAALVANTSNGYYDSARKDFYPIPATLDLTNNPDAGYGVRAIGTASGMTARQLAYRNARAAGNTAAAQAKDTASTSLNNNGSTLANVAIKYGTSGASATFDDGDVAAMKAIVDDLLGTDTKTGALEYIETAYMQYILAYSASAAVNDLDQDENVQAWKGVQGLVEADGATLSSVVEGLSGVSLPGEIDSCITKLTTTKANVVQASGLLNALSGGSYTWENIRPILLLLADPDAMTVNGIKAGEIKQGDNMSALVNSVAAGGLKVTMSTNGGVYADIADHCGDYTASIIIEEVTYNGLTLKNMTARMETKTTVTPAVYLTATGTAVENAKAPASGDNANQPITDMFGYVIDLAFRTNASGSNLLLQQEAVDRIYSDNANEETMGSGSNMTFTAAGGLTDAQVGELMGAIRLVFFDPGNGTVIKCAKLATPTKNGDEWKSNIEFVAVTQGENNVITETAVDGNELMALNQNEAHRLSVLVYLDGNKVGNEDVAAQAATSLIGKLNLQFASSATLVPMDYAQLHTPQTAGGTGGGAATTEYNVTVPTGVTGSAKAAANTDYTFTVADGYTLGTVTVGSTPVTPTEGGNGAYTIPAASVTGDIVINVTSSGG